MSEGTIVIYETQEPKTPEEKRMALEWFRSSVIGSFVERAAKPQGLIIPTLPKTPNGAI